MSREHLPTVCVKPWLISPVPHQRDMDVHRYHPGIKEMEPGEPEVQGPPQLRRELRTACETRQPTDFSSSYEAAFQLLQ